MKQVSTKQKVNKESEVDYKAKLMQRNKEALQKRLAKTFSLTGEKEDYQVVIRQGDKVHRIRGYSDPLTATNAYNTTGKQSKSFIELIGEADAFEIPCPISPDEPLVAEVRCGSKLIKEKELKG